ncbi:Hsp70 protein that interacts with Zuo1p [Recurvomyces mirabilis]|nr:Hsp70 protein that interacts with Zuo1p [Recurvomyces mirabilis]
MSAEEAIDEVQLPARTAIGISFGNSYSSIAYTSDGKAEVIANEEGDRQIPSILSYVSGEEFQGTQAKTQLVRNPRNTIAYFRDLLGKGFKDIDPTPCHASAHPVEHEGGKTVAFVVQEKAAEEESEKEPEKSTLSVSEVTARHIRRLRQSASDYLGKDVTAAVVTIPSDYNDVNKAALTEAASNAGIEILQFIPEPVSALLGYDAKQSLTETTSSPSDKVVVVADLGGTRSDVAVVASRGGIYTTLATAHDYELGGSSLDKVLIEYAAKEFMKKNKKASDPRENERSLAKLTLEAEAVKKALSLGGSASFSIESLADGHDFSLSVNRTRFELLANKVLMSFTRLIEAAVQKADLDILDIDEVLLSGGTSHTPKIASNLQSHFSESTVVIAPSTSPTAINPSELTVRGAAIQASLINAFEVPEIQSSTEAVVTVTPHLHHAIGLVTGEGSNDFAVLVNAETPVPVRRTAQISVKAGGDVLLRLAEGVRDIKISKETKPTTNGNKDDDDEDDDSDDEPEEVREKVWKAGKILAEAGLKGVKKGGKVEIQVNVAQDLGVTIVCREVGGKGGVRGVLEAGKVEANGSA